MRKLSIYAKRRAEVGNDEKRGVCNIERFGEAFAKRLSNMTQPSKVATTLHAAQCNVPVITLKHVFYTC